MQNLYKILTSFLFSIVLIFLTNCSGGDKKIKININDELALKKFMQGKWEFVNYTGNPNEHWRYRFEIEGNKLKIWFCISNKEDPFNMDEGPKIHEFTLSSPTRDALGYHCCYLQFDESKVSLTYRALAPIWIISDEHWDKPELCSGAGVRTWSRTEFESNAPSKESKEVGENIVNLSGSKIEEEEKPNAEYFNEDLTNTILIQTLNEQTYLYSQPDINSKSDIRITKKDVTEFLEDDGDFIKVHFKQNQGIEINGWVLKSECKKF